MSDALLSSESSSFVRKLSRRLCVFSAFLVRNIEPDRVPKKKKIQWKAIKERIQRHLVTLFFEAFEFSHMFYRQLEPRNFDSPVVLVGSMRNYIANVRRMYN